MTRSSVSSLRSISIAVAMLVTVLAPVAFIASTAHAASGTSLIVDTDMYSDADDAGALASAFALQQIGEANVIAVTINTRLDRPMVANNSWKCAAAIAQFYGAGSVPIGTGSPRGDDAASPFTTPCAAKAAVSTPAPGDAVTVLRNALSSQPDHSVVIAETGYAKNLADLLASPGGAELVALKVKMLVEMGGSYLTGNHENNIAGDAGSAKTVSDSWPTKIVWSGSEVGDAVQSGGSIPTTHPATSPVRASYEAFATKFALPNTSINSWDLTAVYHAVRPNDTLLTETGPGANTIDATGDATYGNNTFVPNVAGKQYYLTLTSEAGLESALNVLLNQQPTASTTTTTAAPGSTTTTTQPTTTTTTQVNKPADVDPTTTNGYRLVDIFGTVYSFGVDDYGDLSDVDLNAPIVSATRTASGRGYWLLGADGGIFAFGDAKFYGSMGGQHLNQPVLGMAPTPTGNGYWLVAADGGIFSFGDAAFYGSMGGKHLNQPVVGITSSTSGHGYRMVATDGGIFAFGDAAFYGSMGGSHLNAPIVGMTPSATGNGYRMVATDGGIFAYGDAAFYGSMGGQSLNAPIVGMKATVSGNGYWFVSIDGGVFAFGDAPFVGSLVDEDLDTLIVALA